VSYFFAPVLESHDRERFEIFCYADVAQPDAVTERLQQASDGWLRVTGLRPDAVARRIREDRIDILVDLAGHTGDNPLMVLAHRPAPVQVSWLGYPNTTGMRAVDYRLADAVVEPPGLADELSTETVVRLPHGFHCYEPPPGAPAAAPLPAPRQGHVTFGSFNDLKKTQPAVIRAWAEILNRVPGSRLLLKCSSFVDATTRDRYAKSFAEAGADPERVRMVPRVASTEEHLGLYGKIDIGLDPFPYNGTTTTCEALWMGVPVVTLRGDRHAGRVGASLLGRVGLGDWIADTKEGYVALAVSWASRRDELAALRRELRERVARSPLRDARGLTRAIEDAYRTMWRDARARPR
jgi:predicted O-linked N-acetylglucosamine transferase (SPINDLY family)